MRCVEAGGIGVTLGLERRDFEPLIRMHIPSVQDARQCIIRMKRHLALSTPGVAAVIGLPRATVMDWMRGWSRPSLVARMLLQRLELEHCRPQDPTDPAQDTPTGSVHEGEDVIFSDEAGH